MFVQPLQNLLLIGSGIGLHASIVLQDPDQRHLNLEPLVLTSGDVDLRDP
jgi:hypothetical protein